MAFIKEIETPKGRASYHRIVASNLAYDIHAVHLVVGCYVDEAARLRGDQPIFFDEVFIPLLPDERDADVRKISYERFAEHFPSWLTRYEGVVESGGAMISDIRANSTVTIQQA